MRENVPTTKEGGLPEFVVSGWQAMFAPKNTPGAIQQKLNDALRRALDDPAVQRRLLDMGCGLPDEAERSPQALQERVEREVAHWSLVLKGEGAAAAN